MDTGVWLALLPAAGVSAANLVWIALAAGGAGVLASQYPVVLTALKLLGLAFIAWLAWSIATADPNRPRVSADDAPPRARLFMNGVAYNWRIRTHLCFLDFYYPPISIRRGSF